MFTQLIDGWGARRLCTAMGQANAYVVRNDWQNAKTWLGVADHFSRKATLHRRLLIDMILAWSLIGAALRAQGRANACNDCKKLSDLLQAKFDASEYYADMPGAKGFYDSETFPPGSN